MSPQWASSFRDPRGFVGLLLAGFIAITLAACMHHTRTQDSDQEVRQVSMTASWNWDAQNRKVDLYLTLTQEPTLFKFWAGSYSGVADFFRLAELDSHTPDTIKPKHTTGTNVYDPDPITCPAGTNYFWMHAYAEFGGQKDFYRYEWHLPSSNSNGEVPRVFRYGD